MSDSADWKEKYLSLAEQQEVEAADRLAAEKLLCRTIIRLALATSGLDPKLDPILKRLRDSLRHGFDPSLKRELDSLSDTLMHMGEEDLDEIPLPSSDLLQRLLSRTSLTGRAAQRLEQLSSELMAHPGRVEDERLDELLALLSSDVETASSESRKGLLGWLFKAEATQDREKEEGESVHPNQVLLHLLEKLQWPGRLSTDISSLKGDLELRDRSDAWVDALEKLSDLIMAMFGDVQSEIQATENFLNVLTERLNEIDEHISGNSALRAASVQNGRHFNEAVKGDMEGLRNSARTATDLRILKHDIAQRLDHIQQRIDDHLEDEEQRLKKAEDTERKLREQLQKLEGESEELQNRVREVHHRALKDAVTGLPNRMAYEERLAHDYAVWKRTQGPLALLVWDVDNFKQINDVYGHQSGDKVLRVIGRTLSERPREMDFVGRYGGEEFVMLLVGSPMEDVQCVAEQIRESVAQQGFHSSNKQKINVTISCGISEFRPGDDPQAVFMRADKALYQAKSEGKNRCRVG